jgi:methionine-rich copper-binding protein CopC
MMSRARTTRAGPAALAHGLLAALTLALLTGDAAAHAFVTRTEPRSGATVAEPPAAIRIWFDGPVETLPSAEWTGGTGAAASRTPRSSKSG